jgi:hypothetical protein
MQSAASEFCDKLRPLALEGCNEVAISFGRCCYCPRDYTHRKALFVTHLVVHNCSFPVAEVAESYIVLVSELSSSANDNDVCQLLLNKYAVAVLSDHIDAQAALDDAAAMNWVVCRAAALGIQHLARYNAQAAVSQDSVQPLAKLLKVAKSDRDTMRTVTQALALVSVPATGKLQAVDCGATACLIECCNSPVNELDIIEASAITIQNCAELLTNLPSMVEDGAPAALLKLCREYGDNLEVLRPAVGGLAGLAVAEGPLMVEAGFLPLILSLCDTLDDDILRENVVYALASLSAFKELHEVIIADKRCTALILKAFRSANIDYAVQALANLSSCEEARATLINEKLVAPLLDVCKVEVANTTGEEDAKWRTVAAAVMALKNLALVHEGRLEMGWNAGLEVLALLCNGLVEEGDETCIPLCQSIAEVLARAAEDIDVQSSLMGQLGALKPLVELIELPTLDQSLLVYIIKTIMLLTRHAPNVEHIVATACTPALVQVCKNVVHVSATNYALEALAFILRNTEVGLPKVLEANAVPMFIDLFSSLPADGLENVFIALTLICEHVESRFLVVEAGGVRELTTLCHNSVAETARMACDALEKLICDSTAFMQFCNDFNGIEMFAKICGDRVEVTVVKSALMLLARVALDETKFKKLDAAGILRIAVQLLDHKEAQMVVGATIFIADLTTSPKNRSLTLEAQATLPKRLCACLNERDSIDIIKSVTRALGNICESDMVVREKAVSNKLVATLASVYACTPDSEVLNSANRLIGLCTRLESGRVELLKHAIIKLVLQQSDLSTQQRSVAEVIAAFSEFKDTRANLLKEDGVSVLLGLHSVNGAGVQAAVAQGLAHLSLHEESQQQLVAADAIPALVLLCKVTDTAVLTYATQAMVSFANLNHGRTRVQMAGDDSINALQALCIPSQNVTVLTNVATVFQRLASFKTSKLELARKQVEIPLAALCSTKQPDAVLEQVTEALSKLVTVETSAAQLVGREDAYVLLELASDSEEHLTVARNAAMTVAAMAKHPVPSLTLFRQDGVCTELISICTESKDPVLLKYATRALSCFAGQTCNRETLISNDIVDAIRVLAESVAQKETDIITNISEILFHLDLINGHKAVILDGLAPSHVVLCKKTVGNIASTGFLGATLKSYAEDEDIRKPYISAGFVGALITLIDESTVYEGTAEKQQIPNKEALEFLVHAVGSFAISKPGRREIMDRKEGEGVEVLVNLGLIEQPESLYRAIARAIDNLAEHHALAGVLENLIDEGVVEPLLHMLSQCHDNSAVTHITHALSHLSLFESSRSQVVEDGVMWHGGGKALAALCFSSSAQGFDESVLVNSTKALANLALDDASRLQLVQEKVVPPMLHVLSESHSQKVVANICDALRNLARHDGSRLQMVQDGALPPLAEICLTSENISVLAFAGAALANMALNNGVRVKMVDREMQVSASPTVKCLARMLSFSTEIKEETVLIPSLIALRNLSRQETARVQVCEAGVVAMLIRTTDAFPTAKVRIIAGDIATNLALDQTGIVGPRFVADGGAVVLSLGVDECIACTPQQDKLLMSTSVGLTKLCDISVDTVKLKLSDDGLVETLLKICQKITDRQTVCNAMLALSLLVVPDCSHLGDLVPKALECLVSTRKRLGRAMPKALEMPVSRAMSCLHIQVEDALAHVAREDREDSGSQASTAGRGMSQPRDRGGFGRGVMDGGFDDGMIGNGGTIGGSGTTSRKNGGFGDDGMSGSGKIGTSGTIGGTKKDFGGVMDGGFDDDVGGGFMMPDEIVFGGGGVV